jgi:hypothetical protein
MNTKTIVKKIGTGSGLIKKLEIPRAVKKDGFKTKPAV